jgi:hypothetical protein
MFVDNGCAHGHLGIVPAFFDLQGQDTAHKGAEGHGLLLSLPFQVTHPPDIGEGLEDHVLEGSRDLVDAALGTPLAAIACCVCRKSP